MDISFKSSKLQKLMCDMKALRREYGPQQAELIARRLTELAAADNLEVLATLPQMRAHELKGNRKGQISIDVKQPFRLLFIPDHAEVPTKKDGGLDWRRITKVRVTGVEDTHE